MFTPTNKSRVTCHISRVTCHVSRVTCHVSHVTFLFYFLFFGQSGEAYRWRVCYQRGLPSLVYHLQSIYHLYGPHHHLIMAIWFLFNLESLFVDFFVDTFCGHFVWTLFMDTLKDIFCGLFLWNFFVDPFCGHFLCTLFVGPPFFSFFSFWTLSQIIVEPLNKQKN